jgi:ferredoxin-NADP reductase
MSDQFEAVLTRSRRLSASTMDFRFQRTSDVAVAYEPGQFFRFTFEDQRGLFKRSYSLCNFTDAEPSEMDLVISTVEGGRASELLFMSEPGLKTQVMGPYGRLLIPKMLPDRLFLVATSVGIAPFLPMLSALKNRSQKVILLFGVRDRSEFLYQQELLRLDWPGLTLVVCYSRTVTDLESYEREGHVTAHIQSFAPNPDTDHFLICGNPNMIDDCYGLLKADGFSARQVVREKYLFAREEKPLQKPALTDEQKALIAAKLKKHSR